MAMVFMTRFLQGSGLRFALVAVDGECGREGDRGAAEHHPQHRVPRAAPSDGGGD